MTSSHPNPFPFPFPSLQACVATGIAFPVDDAGRTELTNFKAGTVDFVQFMLDIDSEIIKLTQAGNMTIDEAGAMCPPDQARYVLLLRCTPVHHA